MAPWREEWFLTYTRQVLVPTLRQPTAPTVDRFWRVIGKRLDAFTPNECPNHFTVAGYHAYRSEML
jgi:hypothetical protein